MTWKAPDLKLKTAFRSSRVHCRNHARRNGQNTADNIDRNLLSETKQQNVQEEDTKRMTQYEDRPLDLPNQTAQHLTWPPKWGRDHGVNGAAQNAQRGLDVVSSTTNVHVAMQRVTSGLEVCGALLLCSVASRQLEGSPLCKGGSMTTRCKTDSHSS